MALHLLIGCTMSFNGFAQAPASVKDTAYILLCTGTLDNQQPIISYTIIKDLNDLSTLSAIASQDSFMCKLFSRSVLFEEPAFTLSRNAGLYHFESEKLQNKFLSSLSKKIDKMNKKYSAIRTRTFSNGRSIEIDAVLITGEFWTIPKAADQLNEYNHSFKVEPGCYSRSFIYNLKDLYQSCQLSIAEKSLIEKYVK